MHFYWEKCHLIVGNLLGMSNRTEGLCLWKKKAKGVVCQVYWYISQVSGERLQDQ